MFRSRVQLRAHMKEEHGETLQSRDRDVFCDLCGKTFKGSGSLNAHIASVHNKEKKSFCPKCGKGFERGENNKRYKKHVENCKGTLRRKKNDPWRPEYNCEVCQKVFNKSYNLKVHMTKHTGNLNSIMASVFIRELSSAIPRTFLYYVFYKNISKL